MSAIEFNNHFALGANEVTYVSANRILAFEFVAAEATTPDAIPK
jgi:hypothetical protein